MRTIYFYIGVLISFTSFAIARKQNYEGFKVLRFTPQSKEHINFLQKLTELIGVRFWKGFHPTIGRESDLMLPPSIYQNMSLFTEVEKSGMPSKEYISNVQKLIDETTFHLLIGEETGMNWNQYAELDTIYEFLEEQVTQHKDDVSLITIGKSFEGRNLQVLKISRNGIKKPGIWIDSNIHAREWISGAVLTYTINEILNGEDSRIGSWADDFDFYLMPIANPDGFHYSHTVDRLWRKTRSGDGICRGADPNRNFGYKWLSGGASDSPCDDTYAGSSAFSEPETQAISKFYSSIASQMVGYFTLHAYSQLVLFPFGTPGVELPPSEYEEYVRIGSEVVTAISQRYDTSFKADAIPNLLYPASGGSVDWVKAIHNTTLTFAFELRDDGKYGFLLPPSQIIPTSLEFIDGFQRIIDELRTRIPTSKIKNILKSNTPFFPVSVEPSTFGEVPTYLNSPILQGFRRF